MFINLNSRGIKKIRKYFGAFYELSFRNCLKFAFEICFENWKAQRLTSERENKTRDKRIELALRLSKSFMTEPMKFNPDSL